MLFTEERHLEKVFWVIVTGLTGHHGLSEIKPDPTCLAPQTCGGINLVDRIHLQLIRSYMAMATLHIISIPPQGLHVLFFTRKDRYHPLVLLLSLTVCKYLPKQFYFFPFSFLLLSLTLIQISNYPRVSVLTCQASACHDHKWPLQQQEKLGST